MNTFEHYINRSNTYFLLYTQTEKGKHALTPSPTFSLLIIYLFINLLFLKYESRFIQRLFFKITIIIFFNLEN